MSEGAQRFLASSSPRPILPIKFLSSQGKAGPFADGRPRASIVGVPFTYTLLLALHAIGVKSQTFVHCLSSPASRCSPFEATVTPNSMEQAHVTLFRDWRHSYYLFSSSSGSHLIYFPRQPPSQVQQLLQSPALSVKQGSGLARRWIFTLPPLNVLPRRISLRMRRKTRETIASRQLRPRPLLPSTRDLIANASRISSGRSL